MKPVSQYSATTTTADEGFMPAASFSGLDDPTDRYAYAAAYRQPKRASKTATVVKWLGDKCVASLALLVALPVLLAVAVAIKLESRGPVFFRQKRGGLHGKSFTIYKFRTMTTDACKNDKAGHAVPGDPRVTKLGSFLRKTSLDELPQLLNVLMGEMSLVGPRPHMLYHDEVYRKSVKRYDERFRMKPGLTGWAQVCGHRGMIESPEDMQQRVDHDNYYIENWSLWLEIKIFVKTILVVLKSTNAH